MGRFPEKSLQLCIFAETVFSSFTAGLFAFQDRHDIMIKLNDAVCCIRKGFITRGFFPFLSRLCLAITRVCVLCTSDTHILY